MSAKRLFKIGTSAKTPKDITCNVMIMGAEDVGKTAFVVRYLTKKYLPEYIHGDNVTYERTIALENKFVSLRILDTTGKSLSALEKFCENVSRTNSSSHSQEVFIVMYSVTDPKSFTAARDALKTLTDFVEKSLKDNMSINGTRVQPSPQQTDCNDNGGLGPLLYFVGNKADLTHIRCISYSEGQKVSLSHMETTFFECSTATGPDDVDIVFNDVLQKVLRRHSLLPRASLSGSLTVLSSWSSQPPRRNTFSASGTGSGWWRRHRNSNEQSRTDRTFTM